MDEVGRWSGVDVEKLAWKGWREASCVVWFAWHGSMCGQKREGAAQFPCGAQPRGKVCRYRVACAAMASENSMHVTRVPPNSVVFHDIGPQP